MCFIFCWILLEKAGSHSEEVSDQRPSPRCCTGVLKKGEVIMSVGIEEILQLLKYSSPSALQQIGGLCEFAKVGTMIPWTRWAGQSLPARLSEWSEWTGFRLVICPYGWSLIACVREMTRSGQRHAEWNLCMYLQSPITAILPGVIQQAVQFHSCHHNVVIWIIETGTHPSIILLQTSCSFAPNADLFIYLYSQNGIATILKILQYTLVLDGVYSERGQTILSQWSNKKSLSPSSFARQPLLQVLESIIERAGDEKRASTGMEKLMKFTDQEVSADEQHQTLVSLISSQDKATHSTNVEKWMRTTQMFGRQKELLLLNVSLHYNFNINW